ncbi:MULTISPECIES: hypothetical protein [Streptomyces]|uniref:hypothetical protein n=1 Tax=Streptomyces TaxID=1883 RepID=UPI001679BB0B|nr:MULTISPECIES: hypothetical protein [Streptomyces]MBD3578047.1 hypothetical protein [Streptomyces sp. KD18]GGT02409.1 hypothetical protein GCM10010286_29350 [Streptomyces toxytricini]
MESAEPAPRRSYGRVLAVSTTVLFLEALLAAVLAVLYLMTREPLRLGPTADALASLLAVSQLVLVAAFVLSLVAVLPAVALAGALGRVFGGRDAWPWPVGVLAVLTGLPAAAGADAGEDPTGRLTAWAVATAVLSAAALIGRLRRAGLFGLVLLRGAAVVAGIGLLGSFALWTDIVPKYRPPLLTGASMPGTWSDRTGGTVTLAADGTATASAVKHFRTGEGSGWGRGCSGPGTWTLTPGRRNTWGQRVDIRIPGCPLPAWRVAGSPERPELYHPVGDPDDNDLYELRKNR